MNKLIDSFNNWSPEYNQTTIKTIDAHTVGEPLRIIVEGFPELTGDIIADKLKLGTEVYL